MFRLFLFILSTLFVSLSAQESLMNSPPATVRVYANSAASGLFLNLSGQAMNINPSFTVLTSADEDEACLSSLRYEECNIAIVAKEPTKSYLQDNNMVSSPFVSTGIAILVNNSNPLDDITLSQAKRLFSGGITNWSDIPKGSFLAVRPYVYSSGTSEMNLLKALLLKDLTLSSDANIVNSAVLMKSFVNRYPEGLGFSTLVNVDASCKALKINGYSPSEKDVKEGHYPLVRSFYLITRKETAQKTKIFLEFLKSKSALQVIEESGFWMTPKAHHEDASKKAS